MLRYSLTSLFLILLYASVGCAALVYATNIWLQVAVTMTVVILIGFTLAAVCWTDRPRIFALGFSITGWIYFLLIFMTSINVRPHMLTDSAASWLYTAVHGEGTVPTEYQVVSIQTPNGRATTQLRLATSTAVAPVLANPTPTPVSWAAYTATAPSVYPVTFNNICHSLWAVLLACAGGIVAQILNSRSRRNRHVGADEQP